MEFSNPENIKLLYNLAQDSFNNKWIDNPFVVFNSINNIFYLIYANSEKSIISNDVINNKKINEIKNAHKNNIMNFRYNFDKINKRDLIISMSLDNNIKLWDIKNFDCLLDLKKVNENGELFSSCFLNIDNNIYIISSNIVYSHRDPIKIFDLDGNKIKEINDSEEQTLFIDAFYDNLLSKYFIITGNVGFAKSYDYNKNKAYHKYSDKKNFSYCSMVILKEEKITKLITSSRDGCIKIWDFHFNILLNTIEVTKSWLTGICLWNKEFLFAAGGGIHLINLKSCKVINKLKDSGEVISLKKIMLPQNKECLIAQEYPNKIYLFKNNNSI